jgi:hypothetical protein
MVAVAQVSDENIFQNFYFVGNNLKRIAMASR